MLCIRCSFCRAALPVGAPEAAGEVRSYEYASIVSGSAKFGIGKGVHPQLPEATASARSAAICRSPLRWIGSCLDQPACRVRLIARFSKRNVVDMSETHSASFAGDQITKRPTSLLRAAHLKPEVAAVAVETGLGEMS